MKNKIAIIFAFFSLSFLACNETGPSSNTPAENSLVGTWYVEFEEGEPYNETSSITMTFSDNSTYTKSFMLIAPSAEPLGAEEGTYSVNGNQLTLNCTQEFKDTLEDTQGRECNHPQSIATYRITGSNLTLISVFEDEGEMITDTLLLAKK